MKELPDPESFPPLKPYWLDVLPSLAGRKQHGYGIMQEVPVRTEGKARLWPTTLYGTLKRLMDEEPIEESGRW
jgi:DNA-binding PadR family transcriptional regulator